MCKTYNTVGSLSMIKSRLVENDIYDFNSLKEVIEFQNSIAFCRQQLINKHEELIEEQKKQLPVELKNLEVRIEQERQVLEHKLLTEIEELNQKLYVSAGDNSENLLHKLVTRLNIIIYKRKIKKKESEFEHTVNISMKQYVDDFKEKSTRWQFINSNFEEAVKQSAQQSLTDFERKKAVVEDLSSYIYGALGEIKVVRTLEKLSNEYFLINDFSVSFRPAIYHRQEDDYIKSIQIDHILIAPSGIFIIETKNWSEKSLENLSLRSPVEQIRRASFVLFKLLNNHLGNHYLSLDSHHWGDKKIPIKNLIVMISKKPQEEFQFVKILTLSELLGYINYFKPIFSNNETQRIADFILHLNEEQIIDNY